MEIILCYHCQLKHNIKEHICPPSISQGMIKSSESTGYRESFSPHGICRED